MYTTIHPYLIFPLFWLCRWGRRTFPITKPLNAQIDCGKYQLVLSTDAYTYIHTYAVAGVISLDRTHTYIQTYMHTYINTYSMYIHTFVHSYIHTYLQGLRVWLCGLWGRTWVGASGDQIARQDNAPTLEVRLSRENRQMLIMRTRSQG